MFTCSVRAQRWGDKDDAVATHKQHVELALGRLDDLLVGLLIHLYCRHRLFHVPEHHVQVLVVGVQLASQITVAPQLDLPWGGRMRGPASRGEEGRGAAHHDALVQGEPHQVERFADHRHGRVPEGLLFRLSSGGTFVVECNMSEGVSTLSALESNLQGDNI